MRGTILVEEFEFTIRMSAITLQVILIHIPLSQGEYTTNIGVSNGLRYERRSPTVIQETLLVVDETAKYQSGKHITVMCAYSPEHMPKIKWIPSKM
jgi:hypothetical protein